LLGGGTTKQSLKEVGSGLLFPPALSWQLRFQFVIGISIERLRQVFFCAGHLLFVAAWLRRITFIGKPMCNFFQLYFASVAADIRERLLAELFYTGLFVLKRLACFFCVE
jgi:hypothetical protein